MKTFKSKYRKVGNKILNKRGHHTTAAISYEIENIYSLSYDAKDKNPISINYNSNTIDANLTLSDCFKTVSLNFDINNAEDQRNAMHKIDTLMKELKDFKEGLIEAIKHRDKHVKILGSPKKDERNRMSLNKALECINSRKNVKNKTRSKRRKRSSTGTKKRRQSKT